MVFTYYLKKYPYKLLWRFMRFASKQPKLAVYIAEPLDYVVLKPILKHLPPLKYIVNNKKTYNYLNSLEIDDVTRFCHPDSVIMCRHATHHFPEEKIYKIGFRHGAYHFKSFAGKDYYNAFNVYFMTSQKEVQLAEELGIVSAKSIGFPKLDPAFDGSINAELLDSYLTKANFDKNKKTIIFSSTWDGSGMSAVEKWAGLLANYSKKYNVLVTLHPWVTQKYVKIIKSSSNIYLIEEPDVLPWLMLADVMVADTSSIIAEFCALDKPIITFKVTQGARLVPEVVKIIRDISYQIDDASELDDALQQAIANPNEKSDERKKANQIIFDSLDGKAGIKAAYEIKKLLNLR